jgi:hypothetical protein
MHINKVEKFLVEATLLDLANNDSRDISQSIRSIAVKKNYIENSFPLFVIGLMVTPELRDKMRDNIFRLALKVFKYSAVNNETDEDVESLPIDGEVINTTIKVYSKPYTSSSSRVEEGSEGQDTQNTTVQLVPFELAGIPEDLITKNDNVINEIYQDAKMEDILINILSSVDNNTIFLDTPDNTEKEDSLIIPPFNVIPSIKYLQDIYGIYNSPIIIFFDLQKTYISKIYNENRTYRNNFEYIVIPADRINNDNIMLTPQIDENENVRLYQRLEPAFDSTKEINMNLMGETTIFNSYDYNFDVINRTYNNETNNGKIRYYWNTYQNRMFEESFLKELKYSEIANVTMNNIDPNYFNIDTLILVQTESSYVKGQYALAENSFVFSTNDYKHFTSLVNLKMFKVQ